MLKFGTDGWRAIIADEYTFSNLRIVSEAVARYVDSKGAQDKGVLIGYDCRFLSDKFAREVAEVFAAHGIKVKISDSVIPTPVLAFAVKHFRAFGAVMITASHNPPEYNGFKFIPEYAGPAFPEITKVIEENIKQILENETKIDKIPFEEAKVKGLVEEFNIQEIYLEHIKSIVDVDAIKSLGSKVIVDPLFGAGAGYIEKFLTSIGVEVKSMHNWRDPLFGGGMPEPAEKFLTPLKNAVLTNKAIIGLAMDGDADRFGVIDSKGEYITPNYLITILAMHLIRYKKFTGSLVRTVATTHLIDRIGEKYGITVHEVPVGFKYIAEKMLSEKVIIGGEESGGLSVLGHIPEKDGILADLLALEVVAVERKPLSDVLFEIMREIGTLYSKRINLPVTEEAKEGVISSLKSNPPEYVANIKVLNVTTIDGVKLILRDGSWILMRPSGTEPVVRIYAEATTFETLNRLIKWGEEIFAKYK